MEDFAPTDRRFSINWARNSSTCARPGLNGKSSITANMRSLHRHTGPCQPSATSVLAPTLRALLQGPVQALGQIHRLVTWSYRQQAYEAPLQPQWSPRAKPVGRNDQDPADDRWVCRYTP